MDIELIPHTKKNEAPSGSVMEEAPEDPLPKPPSRWTDVNSALPNLVLGSCYALTAFTGVTLPFMDRHWLGLMMGIEFLVIHSFPFMMLIGSASSLTGRATTCRQVAFWGLFCIYYAMAASMGGLAAVVTFASLTVATYLGYLLRRTSPGAVGQLAMRWGLSVLVFMITATATGMPEDVEEWFDHTRVLHFGMAYFLSLGLLEISGIYQMRAIREFLRKYREEWKGESRDERQP